MNPSNVGLGGGGSSGRWGSEFPSAWYWADTTFAAKTVSAAADRYILNTPNAMQIDIGGNSYALTAQTTINLSTSTNWGKNVAARANSTAYILGDVISTPSTNAYYWECTTAGTSASSDPGSWGTSVGATKVDGEVTWTARFANPTTAANRAGYDFYVYACQPTSGTAPVFKVSPNSTTPYGYSTTTSRKVGGFHCLCVAVGTIASHALSDYVAGDILPYSVWDLKHRANGNANEGRTFIPTIGKWTNIYLMTGTTTAPVSVYGGTIGTSTHSLVAQDMAVTFNGVLPNSDEFTALAIGSNETVTIGSKPTPFSSGGHSTSSSVRRMVSNYGVEEACGYIGQWLRELAPEQSVARVGGDQASLQNITVYHAASPGGNPIYVKISVSGQPYLCCNMATDTTDKWVTFGSGENIIIKHDADAATGGYQAYYYSYGFICNLPGGKTIYLPTSNFNFFLKITHNASASSVGIAINYDDGADERIEFIDPGAANKTVASSMPIDTITATTYNSITVMSDYTWRGQLTAGGSWAAPAGIRSRMVSQMYRFLDYTCGVRTVSQNIEK